MGCGELGPGTGAVTHKHTLGGAKTVVGHLQPSWFFHQDQMFLVKAGTAGSKNIRKFQRRMRMRFESFDLILK